MKDICTAVEHVVAQERYDQGFHIGIFEQSHAAPARIKAACPGIHAEPEVRIVAAGGFTNDSDTVRIVAVLCCCGPPPVT